MSEEKAPASWVDGLEADDKGFVQNRGWDKLDPAAATAAAIKSYREAAKRLGAPPEEMVRLPKDANAPEWKDIWTRLGRPEAPEGYDFAHVKVGEQPFDAQVAEVLKKAFHEANVPAPAASKVVEEYAKHLHKSAVDKGVEAQVVAEAEAARLQANWGANFETNRFIAEKGAQAIGISADTLGKLTKEVGGAQVMEEMRKLGMARGEARYISNGSGTEEQVSSAEQAQDRLKALMSDDAWAKRLTSNDAAARAEYEQLTRRIVEARMARRG